jgi:GAF domain-containing protein
MNGIASGISCVGVPMTYDEPLFVRTLSEFTAKLVTSYEIDEVLGELATRVTELFGLAGCGVSLAREDRLEYVAAVPEAMAEVEGVQLKVGGGPCFAAYRSQEVVAVPDLRDVPAAWAEYAALARRLGVAAVASVPLRLGRTSYGALDMYSSRLRRWTARDLDAARVMADMTTGYLINASIYDKQRLLAEQLQGALDSRVVIEQAKGVLATAYGISVEEAFERIRTHARSNRSTLHAVADAVVRLQLRP